MPNVELYGQIPSRVSSFTFSRGWLVQRARVRPAYVPADLLNLDYLRILGLGAASRPMMLAAEIGFLPLELRSPVEKAGLISDLHAYCRDIVFCFYLFKREAGDLSRWRDGLVIEASQTQDSGPADRYKFSSEEIGWLTLGNYLPQPWCAIFLNSCLADGTSVPALDLLRALAHYLGYLKARAVLRSIGIDPDLTRHRLKTAFALQYGLKTAATLKNASDADDKRSLIETFWLAPLAAKLRSAIASFGAQENDVLKLLGQYM